MSALPISAAQKWPRAACGDGPRPDPTWTFIPRSIWCCSTARRRRAKWCSKPSTACWRTASRKPTAGGSRGPTSTSRPMKICPAATPRPTSCSGPHIAGPATKSIYCHSWMRARSRSRISAPTHWTCWICVTPGASSWWRRQDRLTPQPESRQPARNPLPGLLKPSPGRSAAIPNISTGSTGRSCRRNRTANGSIPKAVSGSIA